MTQLQRILSPNAVPSLDAHRAAGGGKGLEAARHRTPQSIVSLVDRSGLRGRGGAGFPTGRKWQTVASAIAVANPAPVIVNAAEGEPGTFKDRMLLRTNPYLVLEGACIAAHAVGASEIIVAIKASFTQEIQRVRRAIDEIESFGWTDGMHVRVVEGPGEYLFGEETALLEVIDQRPPFPRVTPPYRRGLHDQKGTDARWGDGATALVDNVETLANVPGILRHGAEWYRATGTHKSPGTILCTVTGQTLRQGVGEFAMGTPLREVIAALGGGVAEGRSIGLVLSGVSNAPLGPDRLDTPLTYEAFAEAGSGLGSASFIVIDDQTSLSAVAAGVARFLGTESCGQCEPCKRDGVALASLLAADRPDRSLIRSRLSTVAFGARCSLAGQTERVVGRLLELNGTRTLARRDETPYPIVPLVDIVAGQAVYDRSHLGKRPDWSYADEGPDSFAWPAQHLENHRVEIRPTHTPESVVPDGAAATSPSSDPFAQIVALHTDLECEIDAVRHAPAFELRRALDTLRTTLEMHHQVIDALVGPLVDRLALDQDISWYPGRHDAHALRILERLGTKGPIPGADVDGLCADVHVSIVELDRRVLPVLRRAIDSDDHEQQVIASDLELLIGPS